MKPSERINYLAVIVAVFILSSSTLLADETDKQYQPGYPPYHMGYGMMGGGYGMGPGMMGEGYYSGRHMGPGMMGGYGGMGPGMMGGRVWLLDELDLTEAQQSKINKIQDETRKLHWSMMGEMMDLQAELRDLYSAPKQNSAAIDKAHKKLGQLQQKMYETQVDAQKRMEANLTEEQQEKLRKLSRRGWREN